jgi:hypothetical protein
LNNTTRIVGTSLTFSRAVRGVKELDIDRDLSRSGNTKAFDVVSNGVETFTNIVDVGSNVEVFHGVDEMVDKFGGIISSANVSSEGSLERNRGVKFDNVSLSNKAISWSRSIISVANANFKVGSVACWAASWWGRAAGRAASAIWNFRELSTCAVRHCSTTQNSVVKRAPYERMNASRGAS